MTVSGDVTLTTLSPCLYRYMFQFLHPEDVVAIGRTNKEIHERIQAAIGININDFARWYVETHYTTIPDRYLRMNDWVYAAKSLSSLREKKVLHKVVKEDGKDASLWIKITLIVGFSMFSIMGVSLAATRSDAAHTQGLEFNADSYTWVPAGQNTAQSIGQINWLESIGQGGW